MKNRRHIAVAAIIAVLAAMVPVVTGCPRPPAGQPPMRPTEPGERPAFPPSITGLTQPVAIAFAPDRRIFITERVGRIRVFENGELRGAPFATVDVPNLRGYHETGLLGIALHPDFESQPLVYVYHTYERGNQLLNRVVRFRDTVNGVQGPEVILDNIPGGRIHNGGIIEFGPDGNLFISTGDSNNSDLAQDMDSLAGKTLRVTPDGDIPGDNPFSNSPVFSLGHRNVFGMAFHPETDMLYITENGPNRDDEVNRIVPGGNYGWPIVLGFSEDERFIDPITTYTPNIAPTQAIFYTGEIFDEIRGDFVFGTFNTNNLRALELTGPNNNELAEDTVIFDSRTSIIGVSQSPDGDIYIVGGSSVRRVDMLR